MTNELFSGLGGLMKGLSSMMPQDDREVQLMTAQSEIGELQKQETELYAQIGRQTVARDGLSGFPELSERLKLVQSNLALAQSKLEGIKTAQQQAEQKEKELEAACLCPNCGVINLEGTKFCQECGTKLTGSAKNICRSCKAELAPGSRFCGKCGSKQEV